MKKYKITYPLAGAIPAIAAFVYFFLVQKVGAFYSGCFAVLAGSTGLVTARVIMQNLIDGHNDPKTWQVNIYAMVAIGGWTGAIFAETWGWTSLFMCMVACGMLLCFGTRFLKDEDGNGIPDIFEPRKVTAKYCYDHMLFALEDDKLGSKPDATRPLCLVDGKAYTAKEAKEAGYDDLAKTAIEYIDALFVKGEGK